tara:strand:+ start:7843 stop:8079 length:237 start_codon:yes stop_codon:yes gene_type:complete
MKFIDIVDDSKVFPGEYVLYEPTNTIVLCGAFIREENTIKALGNGRYFSDSIDKFKKIEMNKKEIKAHQHSRCKGCGG